MYGLYDTEGMLRYVGQDRESCIAYADLFGLQSIECLFMDLKEQNSLSFKPNQQMSRNLGESNN